MKKYIFTKGDKYIGMDDNSGGYPYETESFMQVMVWNDSKAANNYYRMFVDSDIPWQLRELHGLNMSLPLGE